MFPEYSAAVLLVVLFHSFFLIGFIILFFKTFRARTSHRNRAGKSILIAAWALWTCASVVCITLFWQAVGAAREASRFAWCNNMFKQYGLAYHNYCDKHGTFPPAYLLDDQRQPAHSWRVLVLSMMGESEIYDRYHFDEPWNGPNNQKLAARPPDDYGFRLYVCPDDIHTGENDTSIVMPVGPEAISDGPSKRKISDITDGVANTIMLGEMSQSGIHWMEPRDLKTDEMSFKINDKSRPGFRSMHPGQVNVLFCDGAVRAVKDDVDPEVLKAAITISGGEPAHDFGY